MQVIVGEFEGIGKRVTLVGKLDIAGAQTIEQPMATLSGSKCNVVVDMNAVDFIASIGIRHLVLAAKAIARGSCKLVLLNPNELVTGVLVTTGLQDLLPIVRSEDEARAVLAQAGSR
jgi:anti-sigma B factor antagonist